MAISNIQLNQRETPKKLEEIFNELGDVQTKLYRNQRAPIRNQKIGELAATGRLSSGIAEHSLGALDQDTALGEATIRASLLPQIGQGVLQESTQDFQSVEAERDFLRNLELAKRIGGMNKPSNLSSAMGTVGDVGSIIGGAYGVYSGNPALVKKAVDSGKHLAGGGDSQDSELYSIFNDSNTPENPLSLYDPNTLPRRRFF